MKALGDLCWWYHHLDDDRRRDCKNKKSWKRVKYVRQNSEGLNVGLNKIRNLRLVPWRREKKTLMFADDKFTFFLFKMWLSIFLRNSKEKIMYTYFFCTKKKSLSISPARKSTTIKVRSVHVRRRVIEDIKTLQTFCNRKKKKNQQKKVFDTDEPWIGCAMHSLSTPPPHETSTTAK